MFSCMKKEIGFRYAYNGLGILTPSKNICANVWLLMIYCDLKNMQFRETEKISISWLGTNDFWEQIGLLGIKNEYFYKR